MTAIAARIHASLKGSQVIFLIALAILVVLLAVAVAGDLAAPMDPVHQSLLSRLKPPGFEGREGVHWLGTDSVGRDILSLIIAGTRPAILVSGLAVGCAATLGVMLGMVCGYRKGRMGDLLLYITNIQLAFPFFLLAVTIVGIVRPSVSLVVFVIALGCWVPFARISYSETMQVVEHEYIEAVKVMRGATARILFRHVLPNILPNILVLATFSLGTAIVMESGLSFVGLGVPTRSPTWGRMLAEGRDYIGTAWWLTVFPGLAIFLLVLAINICGERLRDITDPKQMGR
jgi:peptide/nickel transport system permease protein